LTVDMYQNHYKKDAIRLSILILIFASLMGLLNSWLHSSSTIVIYADAQYISPTPTSGTGVSPDEGLVADPRISGLRDKAEGWQEVVSYIEQVWGKDAYLGVRLAHCESRFRKDAVHTNKNGSIDRGPFQINSFWSKHYNPEFKTNWQLNVSVAYDIFKTYGPEQWVCYNLYSEGW